MRLNTENYQPSHNYAGLVGFRAKKGGQHVEPRLKFHHRFCFNEGILNLFEFTYADYIDKFHEFHQFHHRLFV